MFYDFSNIDGIDASKPWVLPVSVIYISNVYQKSTPPDRKAGFQPADQLGCERSLPTDWESITNPLTLQSNKSGKTRENTSSNKSRVESFGLLVVQLG